MEQVPEEEGADEVWDAAAAAAGTAETARARVRMVFVSVRNADGVKPILPESRVTAGRVRPAMPRWSGDKISCALWKKDECADGTRSVP